MDASKFTKEFVKKLEEGDIIGIQDKQAIEDQMDEGKDISLGETNYEIKSIKTFKAEGEHGCLAECLIFELEREEETIFLFVKIVDKNIAQRIYFNVNEWVSDTRLGIVERGDEYIFEEPEDTDNFNVIDLEYAKEIIQDVDDEEITFAQLPPGELNGGCTTIPKESGVGDVFMTLVEYVTDTDCDNPYLMLTEEEVIEPDDEGYQDYEEDYDEDDYDEDEYEDEDESDEDPGVGGVINFYLGCDISPLDINVYPKKKK